MSVSVAASEEALASSLQAVACAAVGAQRSEAFAAAELADSAPDDSALGEQFRDGHSAVAQVDDCFAVAPRADDHSVPVVELDDLAALPADDSVQSVWPAADWEPAVWAGGSLVGWRVDWQADWLDGWPAD